MSTSDADEFAYVKSRVASAPNPEDIQDLADHAIGRIREVADEAIDKALQLAELMRQLSDLLEQDRDEDEQS